MQSEVSMACICRSGRFVMLVLALAVMLIAGYLARYILRWRESRRERGDWPKAKARSARP